MRNSHVTLQCIATWDGGSLIYYWEKKVLENWITVDSNNRTSYTTNTTGQYRCNVTNEVGSVISSVITVYRSKDLHNLLINSFILCSLLYVISVTVVLFNQ